MKAIVITGIPGAGKSRHRERELGELPFVDIADVYEDVPGISWSAAVCALVTKAGGLAIQNGGVVVLEGLFLPGTPSRRLLESKLEAMLLDSEFIQVHRSYDECKEGILASGGDRDVRLLILSKYYDLAEGVYEHD